MFLDALEPRCLFDASNPNPNPTPGDPNAQPPKIVYPTVGQPAPTLDPQTRTLYVRGTDAGDTIEIWHTTDSDPYPRPFVYHVYVNGATWDFDGLSVGQIIVNAAKGNDYVSVEMTGRDKISIGGGEGNDYIDVPGYVTIGSEGYDEGAFTGGPGRDVLSFANRLTHVKVGVNQTVFNDYLGETITLYDDFEEIVGTFHRDTIDASYSSHGMTLRGGDDNDQIIGSAFADSIYGDAGSDTLYAGDGNDYMDGGAGTDLLWGEGGADFSRMDAWDWSDAETQVWA